MLDFSFLVLFSFCLIILFKAQALKITDRRTQVKFGCNYARQQFAIYCHFKISIFPYDFVVKLLYGCGLRLTECLNLRIHNFNFDAQILTIHDGKGKKDRTVPLPEQILPQLYAQLENVNYSGIIGA